MTWRLRIRRIRSRRVGPGELRPASTLVRGGKTVVHAGVIDRRGVDLLGRLGAAGQVDRIDAECQAGQIGFWRPVRAPVGTPVDAAGYLALAGIGGVEHRLTVLLEFEQIVDEAGKGGRARVGPGRAAVIGSVQTGAQIEGSRSPA